MVMQDSKNKSCIKTLYHNLQLEVMQWKMYKGDVKCVAEISQVIIKMYSHGKICDPHLVR